jgi:hypothetical protein
MSLTIGTGPFGQRPTGRFDFDPLDHIIYVERFPRRVRAERGSATVVDGKLPCWSCCTRACAAAKCSTSNG